MRMPTVRVDGGSGSWRFLRDVRQLPMPAPSECEQRGEAAMSVAVGWPYDDDGSLRPLACLNDVCFLERLETARTNPTVSAPSSLCLHRASSAGVRDAASRSGHDALKDAWHAPVNRTPATSSESGAQTRLDRDGPLLSTAHHLLHFQTRSQL
jgi:hypothetical protein